MPIMDNGLIFRDGATAMSTTAGTVVATTYSTVDLKTILPNPPGQMHVCVIIPLQAAGTGGTSPTLSVEIKDSADNATFSALAPVATKLVLSTAQAANVSKVYFIQIPVNVRRYIGVETVTGGTSPDWGKVRIFLTPYFEGNW